MRLNTVDSSFFSFVIQQTKNTLYTFKTYSKKSIARVDLQVVCRIVQFPTRKMPVVDWLLNSKVDSIQVNFDGIFSNAGHHWFHLRPSKLSMIRNSFVVVRISLLLFVVVQLVTIQFDHRVVHLHEHLAVRFHPIRISDACKHRFVSIVVDN